MFLGTNSCNISVKLRVNICTEKYISASCVHCYFKEFDYKDNENRRHTKYHIMKVLVKSAFPQKITKNHEFHACLCIMARFIAFMSPLKTI